MRTKSFHVSYSIRRLLRAFPDWTKTIFDTNYFNCGDRMKDNGKGRNAILQPEHGWMRIFKNMSSIIKNKQAFVYTNAII